MITPEQLSIISRQIDSLKEQQATLVETITALATAIQVQYGPLGQSITDAIHNGPHSVKAMIDRANASLAPLVDIEQAALLTNRATSTLYNLASSGKLPSVKSGGRLRFDISALEAFNNRPRPVAPSTKTMAHLGDSTRAFVDTFSVEDKPQKVN